MFKTIRYGSGEGEREIDLIPYRTWQEREILLAVSLNEEEFKTTGVEKIFDYLNSQKCITFPKEYDLSHDEKINLLYQLRAISIGETVTVKNFCPSCTKPFDLDLEIGNFLEYKEDREKYLQINEYKLYFKEAYNSNKSFENFFWKIENIINSTNTIDKDEITFFIDNLDIENDIIIEEFVKSNSSVFKFESKKSCPYCKYEFVVPMEDPTFVVSTLSEDSLVSLYKSISNLVFYGHYSKTDIDTMIPFERGIFVSLLESTLKEIKEANG